MLDENLPTFIVSAPSERSRLDTTIHYTQYGSELAAAYTLRRPDPSLPGSKNRYAVALYDSYNPEILFAEVLLIPEWTQPTLSAEQIRLNGGVPPPPEPILPNEFTLQLYNPDQQIVVRQKKPGKFSSSTPSWYFDMPQQTFRQPSASTLDRMHSDPAASDITPKIGLKWKKDGRKDLACYVSGKSTNPDGTKKKSKEPDITIAIFQHLREITLYEPNLQRIEIEDPKGFEVVLLLAAVVIRDVYFGRMAETFNITDPPKPSSTATIPTNGTSSAHNLPVRPHTQPTGAMSSSHNSTSPPQTNRPSRVPPTDPRSQWEIDAETARLRRQTENEARERRRREQEEEKRVRRMLEAEEKEQRRKQAEVDKETERLQKLYGDEQRKAEASLRPTMPPARQSHQSRYSAPNIPSVPEGSVPQHNTRPFSPQQGSYQPYTGGPYLQGGGGAGPSNSTSQNGGSGMLFPGPPAPKLKEKRSFFGGFGRGSSSGGGGDDGSRLQKKKSSIF